MYRQICSNKIFCGNSFNSSKQDHKTFYTSTHRVGTILQSPCPSVRSYFRNRYLSFYWKKWFYIW